MTAIVGFLCRDGVVVGSDSSATFGTGNLFTIEQEPVKKVHVISERLIVAGTGQVGLGQRFMLELEKFHDQEKGFTKMPPVEAARVLAQRGVANFASTGAPKGEFGCLLAFAANDQCHLVEFDIKNFQPEFKTHDICFVSMGGGVNITDSFLGLMRRVFFKGKVPNITDGIFYTTWALHQAIDLNTGGIKAPIQISLLRRENGTGHFKAHILQESEVLEHFDHIKGAEKYLSEYPEKQSGDKSQNPAVIPSPKV